MWFLIRGYPLSIFGDFGKFPSYFPNSQFEISCDVFLKDKILTKKVNSTELSVRDSILVIQF